jgi:hypothetical protein
VPPEQNAAFVAAMEDVLEVYRRPFNARFPVVCMDEKPQQLLGHARPPSRCSPGVTAKTDYEYIRNGTASIFLFCEPLGGWRNAEAKERHTKKDWAYQVCWLLEEVYPEAEKVVLVCDNLNTHNTSSLYETFCPEKALALAKRLEIHYTPKHGSWLNIAEVELSALSKQCLGKRRIDNIDALNDELHCWHSNKNKQQKGVDWQFTTEDARVKLKRLYPVIEEF